MRERHSNTLHAAFADPVRANVLWADVEALFIAAGASISEGRGSRVRVSLNGVDAVFHRPHSAKETDRASAEIGAAVSKRAGSDAMTTMTHEGYVATIELDEEAGLFHGEVINTRDVLTFRERTLDELRIAFADTIADYIDWCRERGKPPERPCSGNFTVRIPPEVYRRVAAAARASTHSWRRHWTIS